jgi:hypothetical protein
MGDTFSKQLTGTLAGQIVMEGFLQIRLKHGSAGSSRG